MLRWSKPVVGSVDVGNGYAGEFSFWHVLQAADIDAVHLSDRRLGSDAERADAAVLAEEMQVLAGVEPVLCEFGLSRPEAEVLRSSHCGPEPRAATDGAVAAVRALGPVEIDLELDCAAMATAAIDSEHEGANRGGSVGPKH